jgi:hypothetical protein
MPMPAAHLHSRPICRAMPSPQLSTRLPYSAEALAEVRMSMVGTGLAGTVRSVAAGKTGFRPVVCPQALTISTVLSSRRSLIGPGLDCIRTSFR